MELQLRTSSLERPGGVLIKHVLLYRMCHTAWQDVLHHVKHHPHSGADIRAIFERALTEYAYIHYVRVHMSSGVKHL